MDVLTMFLQLRQPTEHCAVLNAIWDSPSAVNRNENFPSLRLESHKWVTSVKLLDGFGLTSVEAAPLENQRAAARKNLSVLLIDAFKVADNRVVRWLA